jgi:hypothetical protein
MILKTIKILSFSMLFHSVNLIAADEFKAEIGVLGGGTYYLGDANNLPFKNTQVTYGGIFRYKFNPRFALRTELISTSIVGEYKNETNIVIPFINKVVYSADVCGEFNFFDLEQNPNRRLSKTFSPYIFVGLGVMTDLYKGQFIPEPSLPFGVGIKVKLTKRLNFNAQWSNKILLLSDYMEGVSALNNPINLNGSNLFNNDLLSTLTVGISVDIWKKQCDCKNSNYNNSRSRK